MNTRYNLLKHAALFFVLFTTVICNSKLNAQIYCEGDSVLLNAQNYVAGDVQWQVSADQALWSDIAGAQSLTYMLYPVTPAYYRLLITDTNCLPPYATTAHYVQVVPQPALANAGSDQLNITGNSVTLNANTAVNGTGTWTILSGIGGYIDNIHAPNSLFSGLSGAGYTLRWTISNACGSTHDDVNISFAPFICGQLLTDTRDGQQYTTVLIGSQCWMAKNLNIGQQISGTQIPGNNQIIEKYCYGDTLGACNIYGGMYMWDELMQYVTTESTQGICPNGWHIPSDNEWKILEVSLGMTQSEADLSNTWRGAHIGTALKAGGSSGFDALLGGGRWSNGAYMFINQMGYYWTSTESGANAWRRCLSASDNTVGRWDTFSKVFAFHVRCVKS